jgi:uncharacterized repeat protein (TIGR03803 family)
VGAVDLDAQTFTNLHNFSVVGTNSSTGIKTNIDGAYSYGQLVLYNNALYGVTSGADTNGLGGLFKINADGTGFKSLYAFGFINGKLANGPVGSDPRGGLLLSGNTFYGTTWAGGSNVAGSVFAINADGTGFKNLHYFYNPNIDGAQPAAGLVLVGNRLYGTTYSGGASGKGGVFGINTDGTGFTNLFSFNGANGQNPQAKLAVMGNRLYGTTYAGGSGTSTNGTIFAINTDGSGFTNLHMFSALSFPAGNADGANPQSGMVLSGNILYGAASKGGVGVSGNGMGTIFAVNTDGSGFTNIFYFSQTNGNFPYSDLLIISNTLYGTTVGGGSVPGKIGIGAGTVFQVNTDGSNFAVLHNFIGVKNNGNGYSTNSTGAEPWAGLAVVGQTLYGVAPSGGTNGVGSVFALTVDTIVVPLAVITTTLPGGTAGIAYSQSLSAMGGQTNYSWTNISGTLPTGLNLAADGTLSGIPTSPGTFNFTVKVTDVNSSTATQDLSVVISPAETTAPTVTITSPIANQKWSNSGFTVTGKASDNVAVAGVWVSANGADWLAATLSNGGSNWTAQVSLIPGTNTITAYAVDTSSNVSTTNSVKLIYIVTATLTVSTNGRGSITPNYNNASLQVGANYAMTGKAATGFAFTNWTDELGNIITNGLTLKFVMASNLDFVANFADITKPTLTFTNPLKTGAKWSNALFTAGGKCADNMAVSNVMFALNGADWLPATLSNNGSNWMQQVTLIPGTNTLAAFAVDTSGNVSLTNITKLIYILAAPLTVSTNGRGSITPAYNGALLQIGASYAMTAKPATGFGFVNWTDELGNIITNGLTLKFLMASNLDFVANFADITKPTLSITAPTANQKWSNEVFTVAGKSGDNVAISNVLVSLNGADGLPATLSNNGSNWTQQVTLIPGTNTLTAFAVDTSGNVSLTNSVKLIYIPSTVTLAGLWNLLQFQTPAQISMGDGNNLQGGGSFSIHTGTFTLDTNGLASGALDDPFMGSFTESNGVVSLTITNPDTPQPIVFYANAAKSTMTEVGSELDTNDNYQEIVIAHRVPLFVTMADVAGAWNLLQFKTPAQISNDTLNGLADTGSFTVTNGTLTLSANGTFTGKLQNSVSGNYTLGTNGLVTLHGSSGFVVNLYLNYTKDIMTEVGGMIDTNDNYQEIVVAQRVPATVKAADLAGTWNLVQLDTPAQLYVDGNSVLQGGSNFGITVGNLTINADGTLSGTLGNAFTGTFTVASGGIVHASIISSDGNTPITFILNAGKDTMTEVHSVVDVNDNDQEIVIAHRVPAN